ncbi:hypothetical protein NC797_08205 [Aquibacillus sp. 3ASR75-11]|uniref:Uncharacterized protein n=1 Tax=Terrihalobacillus insolitus TaxID=2950438 RepID=A0A9X3WUI9_9BACI|nr:hypothetical protein [Terrihalobacillus insolitus]MDC3424491.1 hypothetical protein [Terrihalobacillus insolitus]
MACFSVTQNYAASTCLLLIYRLFEHALLVIFIIVMTYLDKRKQKKRFHSPYREKTEQEKEVEREVAKAKSQRGGSSGGIGGGGSS